MTLFRNISVCLISLIVLFPVSDINAAENRPDSGQLLRNSGSIPEIDKDKDAPEIVVPEEEKKKAIAPDEATLDVAGFVFSGNTIYSESELKFSSGLNIIQLLRNSF